MNSFSVSGKTWVLKKYNQENINFLKENFSLDEITSKLLSIRKIKKVNSSLYKAKWRLNENELRGRELFNKKVGKHLIVPLETQYGIILVNRGFIPSDFNIESNIKSGEISINGIVKFQQKINYFTPNNNVIKNEWYYININEVSNFLSLPLLNFYIVEENNIEEKYPIGSQYNINIPNDHLQYAITWFSLALALCIFINIFWRKNVS